MDDRVVYLVVRAKGWKLAEGAFEDAVQAIQFADTLAERPRSMIEVHEIVLRLDAAIGTKIVYTTGPGLVNHPGTGRA